MSRYKFSLCKLHILSVVIIIWNLFFFRRELQQEVEQMYTTYYWIVVTWQPDQVVTWHVGWSLLILVTTLLSLWALRLAKVKMKCFWFATWPPNWSVKWLCGWSPFILSHHPTKFGIRRSWESRDITFLICHVTTWSMCHVTCGWGSLILSHHPDSFGVHRPCESRNIMLLICHVTTWLICYITLWVEYLHPKSPFC